MTPTDVLSILRRRRLIPSLKQCLPYITLSSRIQPLRSDANLLEHGISNASTLELHYRLLGGGPDRTNRARDQAAIQEFATPSGTVRFSH
jgi:hypothetical protein